MIFLAARRVRADLSWQRALELAVDISEASQGQGARWHLTNHMSLKSPLGARREATQPGGGLQPEERHGMTAEVIMIDYRQKKHVQRVFEYIFPYPTSFVERRLDPRVQPTPVLIGTQLLTCCLR
jgi:hypothetical protein